MKRNSKQANLPPFLQLQARPANFHDYESLQSQHNSLTSSKNNLQATIKSLKARLDDSNSALDTLTAKRRLLSNAKDMSDFKVDLGVGPEGRDGWLAVPEAPAKDKLQSQVNALEVSPRESECAGFPRVANTHVRLVGADEAREQADGVVDGRSGGLQLLERPKIRRH